MSLLEQLYEGALSGEEEFIRPCSPLSDAVRETELHYNEFYIALGEPQRELLESYREAADRQAEVECKNAFVRGIAIGVRFTLEALSEPLTE